MEMRNTKKKGWCKTVRKDNLAYYAPPGMELKPEKKIFVIGMVLSVLYSFLIFGIEFSDCLAKLYWKNGAERCVIPGAVMPDFTVILEGSLLGFDVVYALMIAAAIMHYAYHTLESKSIYTMKRLPSRWECDRRYLTLPICGIVISKVTTFVILWICYGFYVGLTPKECLMPGQWQEILVWFF